MNPTTTVPTPSKRPHKKHKRAKSYDAEAEDADYSERRHKDRKKKKRKASVAAIAFVPKAPVIEFTGTEDYYVDKKPERGFVSVTTLNRPACPKYRSHSRPFGDVPRSTAFMRRPYQRYYALESATKSRRDKSKKSTPTAAGANASSTSSTTAVGVTQHRLNEDDFIRANADFNRRLAIASNTSDVDADTWLQLVRHQRQSPQKLTKLQLAERQMDILNKAITTAHSYTSTAATAAAIDRLYAEYADILEQTFPSFEVSKHLDALLTRDPTSYTLWNAQILATQASMARCVVPDVLKLYEQCMKQMYRRNSYDAVMLSEYRSPQRQPFKRVHTSME